MLFLYITYKGSRRRYVLSYSLSNYTKYVYRNVTDRPR